MKKMHCRSCGNRTYYKVILICNPCFNKVRQEYKDIKHTAEFQRRLELWQVSKYMFWDMNFE